MRIKLTGKLWGSGLSPAQGEVVDAVFEGGRTFFHHKTLGGPWFICADGYEAEAVGNEKTDPRKTLREYTDLADGDVVVIAGVDWEVEQSRHLAKLVRGALSVSALGDAFRDMLVDEVRRKPRTKKRRVYEEVDAKDAKRGDLIDNGCEPLFTYYGGELSDHATVLRLIEETEVPA